MLWTSDNDDNILSKIVGKIEDEMVGLQVIATQSWHLPVVKQKVIYTLSSRRKMTILEEFVMKATQLDIPEGVSISVLASLLGLDEIFIQSCISDLTSKQVIDGDLLPDLKLTEIGKLCFDSSMVPEESSSEEIEYYFDHKFAMFYTKIKRDNTCGIYKNYETLDRLMDNAQKFINRKFIVNVGKEQGNVIEHPNFGKSITSILSVQILEKDQTLFSEIWVYDIVEDLIFCRIWDHAKGVFRSDIADFIEKNVIENKFSIIEKAELTTAANEIKAVLHKKRVEIQQTTEKPITLKLYRGSEIKSVFNRCLEIPTEQLIIFSPWITNQVVDSKMIERFKSLARKNVQILIGWGICKDVNLETRPIPYALTCDLLSIRNDKGIPMVCLVHIGNKHEKEIVVDNNIHIAGSFNWLSYRGDYDPRGESVYYLQNRGVVEEQKVFWENEFVEAINSVIFEIDNSMQIVADLNFFYNHAPSEAFADMCKLLTIKSLRTGQQNLLIDLALYCIIKNQYIYESVAIISSQLNGGVHEQQILSILAYLKFKQPQDYKIIFEENKYILIQKYGEKLGFLNQDDYKNVCLI